jgi:LCP family protein required for cell wall assembly
MSTPAENGPEPVGRVTGRASVPAAPIKGSASVFRRSTPGSGGISGDGGSGDNGGYGGSSNGPGTYSGKRKPRWGRITLVSAVALIVLAGIAFGGLALYGRYLNNRIDRVDAFSDITGGRPPVLVDGALNILMLGSDSRDPSNNAQAGKWRSDTIILAHIPKSHDKAFLISIPRDTYVYVPKSPTNPDLGDTYTKINAAFAWGGPALTVQTVETFTGVHIDHVVMIDFGGFKEVTDALGGVDMYIEQDIKSIHPPYRTFHKGMNHLNGEEALDYCRQRYQFPRGDFDRVKHQQEFMRALMDKAVSTGTLTNPGRLNGFLKAVTGAVTVDQQMSVIDLAIQFRGLRSNDLSFLTSPYIGSQNINGESVVLSDKDKAKALYQAVAEDKVAAWVTQNVTPSPSTTG